MNWKKDFHVEEIKYLPQNLQSYWTEVNPHGDLDTEKLTTIEQWIEQNSKQGDYIIIQGEFGCTHYNGASSEKHREKSNNTPHLKDKQQNKNKETQ